MTTNATTATTTRPLFTGSSAGQAHVCPASCVLPHVGSKGPDRVGNVIHEHMHLRVLHGIDYAVSKLEELARREGCSESEAGIARARCMSFDFTPPAGAISELALGYFIRPDGTAFVEPVTGGRGKYEATRDDDLDLLFALTIDAAWFEKDLLRVIDYKSGAPVYTDAVEHNDQLALGSLLAARYFKVDRVLPSIVYIRKGEGQWDTPASWLGPTEPNTIECRLGDDLERVLRQRNRLENGSPLDMMVEGPHCEFCAAQSRCPAKTALLRQLASDEVLEGAEPLTVDQLQRLVPLASQLERAAKRIKAAARAHVEATGEPIPLGDGNVWGPNLHTSEQLEPFGGYNLLLVHGVRDDIAKGALAISLSRDAVDAAFRAERDKREEEGGVGDEVLTVRRFMGVAKGLGLLVPKTETWWSTYRPGTVDAATPDAAPARAPRKRRASAKVPSAPTPPPSLASAPTEPPASAQEPPPPLPPPVPPASPPPASAPPRTGFALGRPWKATS